METEKRVQTLLSGIDFKIPDPNGTITEFMDIGHQNLEQYSLFTARGDWQEERFIDLVSLGLAEKLYPIATEKYGNTSRASLQHILIDSCLPEAESEWRQLKDLATKALEQQGINATQMKTLIELFDILPQLLFELLVELAGRLMLIPVSEVMDVRKILAQLVMEAGHADNNRHN